MRAGCYRSDTRRTKLPDQDNSKSNARNARATSTPETESESVGMLSEFLYPVRSERFFRSFRATRVFTHRTQGSARPSPWGLSSLTPSACKDEDDGQHKCASDL